MEEFSQPSHTVVGHLDDIIALVACHSAVSDISILPNVVASLRRN
jgi:hypothetical protein